MKIRRWTSWRWLLALLLGVGTWWGIAWFLSPRPLYTLSYPADFGKEHDRPDDWFQADSVDQQGRLLLVQQGTYGPNKAYDPVRKVIDLPTGKELVSYQLPEIYQFENGTINTNYLSHPWFGSSGSVLVGGTIGSSKETSKECRWEWNLVTNQKRLLHYDSDRWCYPSSDGSTLIEHFRYPLSPFQGLFPGNVLGLISSEMIAHHSMFDVPHLNAGVVCQRFWSLPELSNRCTIITPSYVNSGASNFSNDGRWLILYDHFLDSYGETAKQTNRFTAAPPRSPNMIKVYDTMTGKLWCEIPAPSSLHQNWRYLEHGFSTIYPVVHDRGESDHSNGMSQPKKKVMKRCDRNSFFEVSDTSYLRYFHIPTKSWLDFVGDNSWFQDVASVQENVTSWLRHSINSQGCIEVFATDQRGHTRQTGFVDLNTSGYTPMLIAHSTQMVFQWETQSHLPQWMVQQLRRFEWLAKWLNRQPAQEIVVYDYQRNKNLWRMGIIEHQHVQVRVVPTGSFLVVSRLVNDNYEVVVLALPLSDWSSWWARTAGMIVVALSWYFLCWRKVKSTT